MPELRYCYLDRAQPLCKCRKAGAPQNTGLFVKRLKEPQKEGVFPTFSTCRASDLSLAS